MKKKSPDNVQMSTAAAMTFGYFPGKFHRNDKLKSLNLLVTYESGCRAKCAFCGLAGSRELETEEDKTFIRVDWPCYDLQETVDRTKDVEHLDRVCVSMITHEHSLKDMCTIMKKFKDETDLSISGLIGPTNIRNREMLEEIKRFAVVQKRICDSMHTRLVFGDEDDEALGEKSVGNYKFWLDNERRADNLISTIDEVIRNSDGE